MNARLILLGLAFLALAWAQTGAFDNFQTQTLTDTSGSNLVDDSGIEIIPDVFGGSRQIIARRPNGGFVSTGVDCNSAVGNFAINVGTALPGIGNCTLIYAGPTGMGISPPINIREQGCGCFNVRIISNDVALDGTITMEHTGGSLDFPFSIPPVVAGMPFDFCVPFDQNDPTVYDTVTGITLLLTVGDSSDAEIDFFCCQPTVACSHTIDNGGAMVNNIGDTFTIMVTCQNYDSQVPSDEDVTGTFPLPAFLQGNTDASCSGDGTPGAMSDATGMSFSASALSDGQQFTCTFTATAVASGTDATLAATYQISPNPANILSNLDVLLSDAAPGSLCDVANAQAATVLVQPPPSTLPPTTEAPTAAPDAPTAVVCPDDDDDDGDDDDSDDDGSGGDDDGDDDNGDDDNSSDDDNDSDDDDSDDDDDNGAPQSPADASGNNDDDSGDDDDSSDDDDDSDDDDSDDDDDNSAPYSPVASSGNNSDDDSGDDDDSADDDDDSDDDDSDDDDDNTPTGPVAPHGYYHPHTGGDDEQ